MEKNNLAAEKVKTNLNQDLRLSLVCCDENSLFLHRMPPNVQAHLLDLNINDTDALAKKADSLFQSHNSF